MTAPMTQATYVASELAIAAARGVTDAEALRRIRVEATDVWQSRLNTYSGSPSGGTASN